jgi:hypothetical protein
MSAENLRLEIDKKHQIKLEAIFNTLFEIIKTNIDKCKFQSIVKYSDDDFPLEWFSLKQGMYRDKLLKWAEKVGFQIQTWERHEECHKSGNYKAECKNNCSNDAGILFTF